MWTLSLYVHVSAPPVQTGTTSVFILIPLIINILGINVAAFGTLDSESHQSGDEGTDFILNDEEVLSDQLSNAENPTVTQMMKGAQSLG